MRRAPSSAPCRRGWFVFTQARHFLLPGLPRFPQQYPDIRLHFSEVHQPLDMIREGFDCILRAGELNDSPLIKRRLSLLERGTFASPGYLGRFGTPQTPDDLTDHEMMGLGLIQVPRYRVASELAGGSLLEVLSRLGSAANAALPVM